FRYADCIDRILMIVGCLAAMIHGAAFPVMIIVFGDMIDLFVNNGIGAFLYLPNVQAFINAFNISQNTIISDQTVLL
ncbi:hypothetical protein LOTGIDRAFT_145992, partial [Lottia gigantea]